MDVGIRSEFFLIVELKMQAKIIIVQLNKIFNSKFFSNRKRCVTRVDTCPQIIQIIAIIKCLCDFSLVKNHYVLFSKFFDISISEFVEIIDDQINWTSVSAFFQHVVSQNIFWASIGKDESGKIFELRRHFQRYASAKESESATNPFSIAFSKSIITKADFSMKS